MKRSVVVTILVLGASLILSSCGKEEAKSGNELQQELLLGRQNDQGVYRADLTTLNPMLSEKTSGSVEIRIDQDVMSVESKIFGAPIGVKHLQNITVSTKCPEADSDSNGDGFIDFDESLSLTGIVLIPLDSDIGEQLNGMDFGPIANESGNYIYRKSTKLTKLLDDLHATDPDPLDVIAKLNPDQHLNLSGRVVLIHGVDSSYDLPETVGAMGAFSKEQSLPIACGKLIRVSDDGQLIH